MTTSSTTPFVVLKFGGTSVATAARWRTILGVARARVDEGLQPVVVCSAITKMTDALEKLLQLAVAGDDGWRRQLQLIRDRHHQLATELELSVDVVAADLDEVERLAMGASLLKEASPRLLARMMAMGEIMSTRLGAAFFVSQGVVTTWVDARTCLTSITDERRSEAGRVLNAEVSDDERPELQARFRAIGGAIVTQGFIATDELGATVLLGRGGSDTSASLFAAALRATRCEIWTDVPGVFTADPRLMPLARLVKECTYAEAQEIASMGAKVLHPRAIPPCRRHRIPLEVRWTDRPDSDRTTVTDGDGKSDGLVKAITHKRGVVLVSMETSGMWQQVGFLADVFACFKARGLSVDLVSTSEMNVTATLDAAANTLDDATLLGLERDLAKLCTVRVVRGCAAVSLVGRRIRAILHQLGPVLAVFAEQQVHLVSQAASDLNLTFVVDEEHAEKLVRELHALLFSTTQLPAQVFGPAWKSLFESQDKAAATAHIPSWWRRRRHELLRLAREQTPRYVIDGEALNEALDALATLTAVDRLYYAMKANPHPEVLRRVVARGFGLECVSPGEQAAAFAAVTGLEPSRVLFTPNFVKASEYQDAFARGVTVTVDNLHPLLHHPEVFAGRDIFVRLDPGHGAGHHRYVHTGGELSKFGIPRGDLEAARAAVARAGARVVGLHAHAGSGILDPSSWAEVGASLMAAREAFPDVTVVDVGGGLGVAEKPGQGTLDLRAVNESLQVLKAAHPGVAVWMEPGRFVVARAGVLLLSVTQLKEKGDSRYIGVDGGMNALIRPALYGAYHEILNLSRLDEPAELASTIVGPICESGDVLGYARRMPTTIEGDVILIGTTGAYGRAMASTYNLRAVPEEVYLPASPRAAGVS
jgi:bifunctional diaminopimelate decarboxylase / aspartate kinase